MNPTCWIPVIVHSCQPRSQLLFPRCSLIPLLFFVLAMKSSVGMLKRSPKIILSHHHAFGVGPSVGDWKGNLTHPVCGRCACWSFFFIILFFLCAPKTLAPPPPPLSTPCRTECGIAKARKHTTTTGEHEPFVQFVCPTPNTQRVVRSCLPTVVGTGWSWQKHS